MCRFRNPLIVETVLPAEDERVVRMAESPASVVESAILPAKASVNAGIWLAGHRSR